MRLRDRAAASAASQAPLQADHDPQLPVAQSSTGQGVASGTPHPHAPALVLALSLGQESTTVLSRTAVTPVTPAREAYDAASVAPPEAKAVATVAASVEACTQHTTTHALA